MSTPFSTWELAAVQLSGCVHYSLNAQPLAHSPLRSQGNPLNCLHRKWAARIQDSVHGQVPEPSNGEFQVRVLG